MGSLPDYEAFVAVVERGSLTAAARHPRTRLLIDFLAGRFGAERW